MFFLKRCIKYKGTQLRYLLYGRLDLKKKQLKDRKYNEQLFKNICQYEQEFAQLERFNPTRYEQSHLMVQCHIIQDAQIIEIYGTIKYTASHR